MTKPTGRKSAANPPLFSAKIRGQRLPPARFSISISFSPPVTSLLGNHRRSRGGLALEEHCMNVETYFRSYSDWAAFLKQREWLFCGFFFFFGGVLLVFCIYEWERYRESKCAALRRSIIIYQTPAATLPILLLLLLDSVQERKRDSGRVRESRLQASGEETSRGGSAQGKRKEKKIHLSLLLPLFAHLTGSGEQKRSPAGVFPHSVFPPFLRLYQTVGGARGEPPPRARPVTSLLSRRRVSARAGMLNNLTDTEEGDGGAQSQGEWWDASGSCTHTDDTRVRWHNDAGILYVCPLSSKPRKVNIRNAGSHSTQLQRPSEDTCVCVRAHACVCVLRHCTLGSLLPSTAAALTARLLWQE